MPRKARIDIKDYYYHIIARGQRKNPLFFSNKDFDFFIELLDKQLTKYDIKVYAFCLMKNHYHLLVKRNNDSLEKFFKNLHTKYAIYFNRKYKLVGHVFQGRYKSFIILNEKYLYALLKYIHNNPIKAKIVNRIGDYKYSSYNFYKNNKQSILKNIHQVNILNNRDKIRIEDYINNKEMYIGEEVQYKKIQKRKLGREKGISIEKRQEKKKIQKDYEKLCEKFSVNILIKDKKYKRDKDRERYNKIIYQLERKGYTKAEIARFFNVHKSTILRRINEYENKNKNKNNKK